MARPSRDVVFVDGVRYSTSAQRGGINTFLDLVEPTNLQGIDLQDIEIVRVAGTGGVAPVAQGVAVEEVESADSEAVAADAHPGGDHRLLHAGQEATELGQQVFFLCAPKSARDQRSKVAAGIDGCRRAVSRA